MIYEQIKREEMDDFDRKLLVAMLKRGRETGCIETDEYGLDWLLRMLGGQQLYQCALDGLGDGLRIMGMPVRVKP